MTAFTSAKVDRCDQSLHVPHIPSTEQILASGKKKVRNIINKLKYDEDWMQRFYYYCYRKRKKKTRIIQIT